MGRVLVSVAILVGIGGIVWNQCSTVGRRAFPPPAAGSGVVISGASSGIGRHAAETLAALGFLVFAGVRNDRDAEEVAASHPNIIPLRLDVSSGESIAEAAAEVERELLSRRLPLAAVVNNAGISYALPVELMDLSELRKVLEVNLVGVVAMTQAFIGQLRESQGRIIHVGSVLGFTVAPLHGAYSASKFGLNAITDASRMELLQWNISVSLIEPGTIKTKIQEKMTGPNAAHTKLPPEKYALYRQWFDGFDEAYKEYEKQAGPITLTTDAIVHAVTSEYPRTRYTLGAFNGVPFWVSKFLLSFMPDRLHDDLKTKNVRV